MKNTALILVSFCMLFSACVKDMHEGNDINSGSNESKLVKQSSGQAESGTLLIKVDASTAGILEKDGSPQTILSIFGMEEIESVEYATKIRPKNLEVAKKYGLDRWYKIRFDENIDNAVMAEKITTNPRVVSIQYNMIHTPEYDLTSFPASSIPQTRSAASEEGSLFNDPYLPAQWHLVNDGTMEGSVAGADIGVRDAWKLTAGDNSIVVAVFDCAVKNIHKDLKNAVWINADEIKDNGIDDDDNGYIDDYYGFNFVDYKEEISKETNEKTGKIEGQSLNWSRGSGHGTHVAGTVGATNNNGIGVCSVAGGSGAGDGVRLMSCQIFNGEDGANDTERAAAYYYAADNGACIAQCSYGNTEIITDDDTYINGSSDIKGSPLENAALRYFLDPQNSNHPNLTGNIAVFSSMNEGHPYSGYPAALPYCISVSAFGYDFTPSGYTNYGPGCKISAPGGEYINAKENGYEYMILSTAASEAANLPQYPYVGENDKSDKGYVYMQGTSMACPHVSGVVALGIAYAKKLGKTLTRDEFISKLLLSVNDLDPYCDGTKQYNGSTIDLSKYKGKMGTGALDAWKFLMAIEGTPMVMTQPGSRCRIRIPDYTGATSSAMTYTVDIDEQTRSALGIGTTDPTVSLDGTVEFTCSKLGSGKITLHSSIGKDPGMSDGIGAMDISKEISIVCRSSATTNGGWL